MEVHGEPLSGGLVTSRDASLLAPGELVQCTEAHYRPNSMALQKVGGRAVLRQHATTPFHGLGYLAFDGGRDKLLYQQTSIWQTVDTDGSSTGIHVTGRAGNNPLSVVHYENKYGVGNGVDTQWLFTSGLSTSVAGDGASASGIFPFGLTTAVSGFAGIVSAYVISAAHPNYTTAWSPETLVITPRLPSEFTRILSTPVPLTGTDSVEGSFYWTYWVTEYISALDMESGVPHGVRIPRTASGGAASAKIAGHVYERTQNIRLTLPTSAENGRTTHRRIYRGSNPLTYWQLKNAGLIDLAGGSSIVCATANTLPLIGELVTTLPLAVTTYTDYGAIAGLPFASITTDVLGFVVTVPRDGPAPKWTTGSIFQDSFMCNDTSDKSLVRYSYPSKIWSFPSIYYFDFATEVHDDVTLVQSLGTLAIVGLKNFLYRIDYLPRETDSQFQQGRAYEKIADQGISGPQAAATFTMEGTTPMLAMASRTGLWLTDGYRIREATRDLDWTSLVDIDAIDDAVLINVPHLWSLVLYYTPVGGTGNTKALYLSYHPQHLKEGKYLAATGPVTITNAAGESHVGRARVKQAVYGGNQLDTVVWLSATAGPPANQYAIYKEDQTAIAALPMSIKTRMIYPKGLDADTLVDRLYLLSTVRENNFSNSVRVISRKADKPLDSITGDFKAVATGILDRIPYAFHAEAFQAHITGNNSPVLIGVRYDAEETK